MITFQDYNHNHRLCKQIQTTMSCLTRNLTQALPQVWSHERLGTVFGASVCQSTRIAPQDQKAILFCDFVCWWLIP